MAGSQQVATAAGIRAAAKARRKDTRSEPGFGVNRCLWHRHALSAYTSLRTNQGPQNYWLHFVCKANSPACPNCDHPSEDGHHITFDCPHYRQQRQERIGDARTWEDLDKPIWRKEEGEEEEWDAVEAYFAYSTAPSLDDKGVDMVIPESGRTLFTPAIEGFYVFYGSEEPDDLPRCLDLIDQGTILRSSLVKSRRCAYVAVTTMEAARDFVRKVSLNDTKYAILEHAKWAEHQWETDYCKKHQELELCLQEAEARVAGYEREQDADSYSRCLSLMEQEGITKLRGAIVNLQSATKRALQSLKEESVYMPWPQPLMLSMTQAMKDLEDGCPIFVDENRDYSIVYEGGMLIGATWDGTLLGIEHNKGGRDSYIVEPLGVEHHRGTTTSMRTDAGNGNALYNPARPELMITHESMCDTGSEDPTIRSGELAAINPHPRNLRPRTRVYILADGTRVRRRVYDVEERIEDRVTGMPITG
ncbi:hypothetical protein EV426DRAFT_706634 [Tirmania nivea]|nr:hypothetical protein EV426DRAFT_706634 [Tirmania nivea]